jgi:SPOR domain
VWYGYGDTSSILERKIMGTTDGYRVQVISTDDIEEANRVRAEIYEKTARKEVYITFEPPFYKVKAGDFTSKSEADDFKFKLNQLGYTEAKVVQETINLFE